MNLSPVLTTASSHVLLGSVDLWPSAATAQEMKHWAEPYVNSNPAFRWMVAKYVESGNPNRNNHMWSPDDLRDSVESIHHTPMNMLHKASHVVGTFVAGKYMEEEHDNTLAQAQEAFNPYVEVVGPFWSYYFPNELQTVEAAYEEGRLFVSMECVAETARWHRTDGEHRDFIYMGPNHKSYGEWQSPGNILQFVNPHFLGGGLIVPPVDPGWSGAEVRELARIVSTHQDEAEDVYETVAQLAPHLSTDEWENVMLFIMHSYAGVHNDDEDEKKKKSAYSQSFKVGDYVKWGSSGGTARGRITRIVRNGVVKVPDSTFSITGTPENPAALIRVYRDGEQTDRVVGHRFSTLSKDQPPKSSAKVTKSDSFKPTAGMVTEAKRGLEWRSEFGRGGTAVGISRARDIKNGKNLPYATVKRVKAFFDRHQSDKKAEGWRPGEKGYPSNGRIAHALWGGDAGYTWAKDIVKRVEGSKD
jgi:hypothetical protein